VTPVAEIDNYKFQAGEITRNLMNDYDALVGKHAAASAA
jgi:hypothetical protein